MNRKIIITFAFASLLEALSANIVIKDFEASINLHPEFPAAKGSLCESGGVWSIQYDFSHGGHGVGMVVKPRTPIRASRIEFDAKHDPANSVALIVTDSTGQKFRKVATPMPGVWRRFSAKLSSGWMRLGVRTLRRPCDELKIGKNDDFCRLQSVKVITFRD